MYTLIWASLLYSMAWVDCTVYCTPWSGASVHYGLPDLGWSFVVYFLTILFLISGIVCTFFLGLIVCNVCITRVDWTLWPLVEWQCVYSLTWGDITLCTLWLSLIMRCVFLDLGRWYAKYSTLHIQYAWSGVTLPCTPWPGVTVRYPISSLKWLYSTQVHSDLG